MQYNHNKSHTSAIVRYDSFFDLCAFAKPIYLISHGRREVSNFETMLPAKLSEFEKAINQVLLAYKVIDNGKLQEIVNRLRIDFPMERERSLEEVFKRINSNIRPFSFEIKTVISSINGEDDTRNYYHGIANTNSDELAREYGSLLDPEEVQYYSRIVTKLIERKRLSSDEVVQLKNDGWSRSRAEDTIKKLKNAMWLGRDRQSYWILGVRSYLELSSSFLQDLLREDQANADGDDISRHMQPSDLPQIIYY